MTAGGGSVRPLALTQRSAWSYELKRSGSGRGGRAFTRWPVAWSWMTQEELAARPQMVVQVSPFSLGEDRPLAHPITLLSMPNRTIVGYGETQRRGFLERDVDILAEWAGEYDQLQVEALSRAASREFIRQVRRGFENG